MVLFIVNGACWWFFRSYLNFLIAFIMVGVIWFSAGTLWHERNKLKVEASLPGGSIGKNTSIPFFVRIVNKSKWMFPISVKYTLKNIFTGGVKECSYLGATKPAETKIPYLETIIHPKRGRTDADAVAGVHDMLEMKHYGHLSVQIGEVKVYDFLHLFYYEDCARQDAGTVAAPGNSKVSDQVELRIAQLMPEESRRKSVDYSADYEIREYRPMDDMRDIHWKLTAKQRKLMVRERLSDGKPSVNVLLELTQDVRENDTRMEILDGLCRRLLEEKYPVKLFWCRDQYELKAADIGYPEELDTAIFEILSGSGIGAASDVTELFAEEHPGEEMITVGER